MEEQLLLKSPSLSSPPPLEELYTLKPKGWFDAQFQILYEGISATTQDIKPNSLLKTSTKEYKQWATMSLSMTSIRSCRKLHSQLEISITNQISRMNRLNSRQKKDNLKKVDVQYLQTTKEDFETEMFRLMKDQIKYNKLVVL